MNTPVPTSVAPTWPRQLLDVLLRVGLVIVLVAACFRVFRPFLELMLWAVILAITLYPLQVHLRKRMGPRDGRIATLIVVVVVALLAVPTWLMAAALADSAQQALAVARSGHLHVPPPNAAVKQWPIIGPAFHDLWTQAATDLTSLARKFAPQLRAGARTALAQLASAGLGLLLLLAALVIAGIVLAFAQSGTRAAERIATRLFGTEKGPRVLHLCTATIRAVAQGVVGIAFIQALLVGMGFALIGVPGAGLLALVVMVLGIMQVPATLVTIPVIVYVFATQGVSGATIVFAVYVFVAGLIDNVLKPLLLGRGVEVPMPVVLIGALGGMVTMGIVGLFIGPVVLAVGYQLFWQWVEEGPPPVVPPPVVPVEPPPD